MSPREHSAAGYPAAPAPAPVDPAAPAPAPAVVIATPVAAGLPPLLPAVRTNSKLFNKHNRYAVAYMMQQMMFKA